jgi:hypothetical protein
MEFIDYDKLKMLAHEAFIRRASLIDLPFMLKGSYVTRQYFENPNDRIPADLDWVYLEHLKDEATARTVLNYWATQVTELDVEDGVKFMSFTKNEFWRRIDYAMADDFPTVNTDLKCFVDDVEFDFGLDISFNLDVEQPPVTLLYKPMRGDSFIIPTTVPLSLQISWKISQTLFRPRFKDLYDLMYLIQHPSFDRVIFDNAVQELINELNGTELTSPNLKYFLNYEIEKLFYNDSIQQLWDEWRHEKAPIFIRDDKYGFESYGKFVINISKLPVELDEFLLEFYACLDNAGFNSKLINKLPKRTKPIVKYRSYSLYSFDEI